MSTELLFDRQIKKQKPCDIAIAGLSNLAEA
jgi:hypothetical protein